MVWGKERLRIREDSVLIEAIYYDQDMQPRAWCQQIGVLEAATKHDNAYADLGLTVSEVDMMPWISMWR